MSTIAVKLTSLAIRTLAKPIANSIKQQAREHPRFRAICISIAQAVHRTDMRIRLNLLRDSSVVEKAEEEEERRKASDKHKDEEEKEKESIAKLAGDAFKDGSHGQSTAKASSSMDSSIPTPPPSPSSDSSSQHSTLSSPKKKKSSTPHIRPLSDAKAIERGANFISEAFLFSVAGGLILFETLRSRKKEMNRRDEVSERLQSLEEVDEIWRQKVDMLERRLNAAGIEQVPELPSAEPQPKAPPRPEGLVSKIAAFFSKPPSSDEDAQRQQAKTIAIQPASSATA
ncbi:hypothetical protein Dda_1304 [Drechslerella dactyloides]|uniref:OPA3-like protein n=1 Tax=Drechslerella dactyloides TaxID=74499 RepID=A0AAD6NLN8_DREDA|nr:hypothetical protein Dda_1304 [Drechslerella dactyloides]